MKYANEIQKRKTFAIISHPDAGKTTLTEKLLLFGGAIQTAGAVKSNKIKKHATSDFMEIERQRGISVATSVMSFEYKGILINLLDTPGIFSELAGRRRFKRLPARIRSNQPRSRFRIQGLRNVIALRKLTSKRSQLLQLLG